jgi:hypothetical protein
VSDGVVFAADEQAYIQIDVTNGSLPGTDQTDVLTITYPDQTLTPDYEGFETATGKKIRYRAEVCKNTDAADTMISAGVYLARYTDTATAIATGESLTTSEDDCSMDDLSAFPSKSAFIYNVTKNDCRYMKYRSGSHAYFAAANDWSVLAFDAGVTEISVGDTVTGASSSATGVVASVQVNTGTWGSSNAAGFLILSDVTDNFSNDENIQVSTVTRAVANGADVKGIRGFTAVAWEAEDVIEILPEVDIGIDAPSTLEFEDPSNESTAPAGVVFTAPDDSDGSLTMGDLASGEIYMVWRREWIMEAHRARANVNADTIYLWS